MKQYTVTLIPGDGTGPELIETAVKVIEAAGVKINWERCDAGADAIAKHGTPVPEPTLASIRKNKIALKGPVTTPIGTGFRSVNVAIRKELDLYACLRPCKLYPGIKSPFKNVDITVVRENTEDLYAGVEFKPDSEEANKIISLSNNKIRPHSAISIKPISKEGSERIVRFAFEYALKHKRKKVTAISKANIMKFTDGLFLETGREVAKDYKGRVEYEENLVDSLCMQLVQTPENFDVLVLPNLYGDIISDLCAGLVGGLGVAPGVNIGKDSAVFEAVHGSAPKFKGLYKLNPIALILSGALMLEYLGEPAAAKKLEAAVAAVIKEGKTLTSDLGGTAGTKEIGQAIIEKMR